MSQSELVDSEHCCDGALEQYFDASWRALFQRSGSQRLIDVAVNRAQRQAGVKQELRLGEMHVGDGLRGHLTIGTVLETVLVSAAAAGER